MDKRLTYPELKLLLEEVFDRRSSKITAEDFLSGDFDDLRTVESYFEKVQKIPVGFLSGQLIGINNDGGMINDESTVAVWYFENHDIYVRFDGTYSSYESYTFDAMYQVFPSIKEFTIFGN